MAPCCLYDPGTGQFISQDAIRLAGGPNPYRYAPNPLMWIDPWGLSPDQPDNFGSLDKLLSHFDKHGSEFGAQSPEEYLNVGRGVIKDGYQVQYQYKGDLRTGYVQYMGNTSKGAPKFAFVGTNADGDITTIHTKSGKDFWKTLNGVPNDKTIRPTSKGGKIGGCNDYGKS